VKTPDEPTLKVEKSGNGVRFSVKVGPGSSRTIIAGILGGMLKVKIAAPPEKGKANQTLIEFLSRFLGVRKNQITITAGAASPVKTLQVAEITAQQVHQAFNQDTHK